MKRFLIVIVSVMKCGMLLFCGVLVLAQLVAAQSVQDQQAPSASVGAVVPPLVISAEC
jgi:hypothetical protein